MGINKDPGDLEKRIRYKFTNKKLLQTALTHSSLAYEKGKPLQSYERLELLGDSVLNFIVTDYIFNKYSDLPEGRLAKLRAALIDKDFLVGISEKYYAADFLIVSKSAEYDSVRKQASVKADLVEALIGAIYLDSGLDNCRRIILENVEPVIDKTFSNIGLKDYKSRLQELTMKISKEIPVYEVLEEVGAPHEKVFTVRVNALAAVCSAKGRSKKEAEQKAARAALEKISSKQKSNAH